MNPTRLVRRAKRLWRRRKRLLRGLIALICAKKWHLIALSAVLLLASAFDPFGIESNTNRFSQKIFYQVMAPYYPEFDLLGSVDLSQEAVDSASVVLLIDSDLQFEESSWPAPYEFHAEVLNKILSLDPKGVMVDFGFMDTRDYFEIEPLLEAIDFYCESEVPILFAGARPSTYAPLGIRRDLGQRTEIVSLVDPGPLRDEMLYPFWKTEAPLGTRDGNPLVRPTAAFALYEFSQQPGKVSSHCLPERTEDGKELRTFSPSTYTDKSIKVFWAAPHLEANLLPTHFDDCHGEIPPASWFSRFVVSLVDSVANPQERVLASRCAPIRSITVKELFYEDSDESVRQTIQNRYVFYGGYLEMTDDLIAPPTHWRIPGVYMHAMAFDNLTQWGTAGDEKTQRAGPIRPTPDGSEGAYLAGLYILLTAVLWGIVEAAKLVMRPFSKPSELLQECPDSTRGHKAALLAGSEVILIIIVLGAGAVQFLVAGGTAFGVLALARIEPINFMGVVLLVAFTEVLNVIDYLRDALQAWSEVLAGALPGFAKSAATDGRKEGRKRAKKKM